MKVIDKNLIFLDTEFKSQQEIFGFLATKSIETKRGNDVDLIVQGFYDRELEFSTAMDEMIAIPHCRNKSIIQATVIVIRNKYEIEWTDHEQVKILFALLVPGSNDNQMHVRILAQVAQLIMEDDFKQLVSSAREPSQIYEYMEVLNNFQEV